MKRHDNDATKAEQWLHEQAEKEGWLKAKKLEGRTTAEGLVGVLASQNHVALVEVRITIIFESRETEQSSRTFLGTLPGFRTYHQALPFYISCT